MIVYKITNKVNGKIYIGQTRSSLHSRWRAHCSAGSNARGLAGAVSKYGKDSFYLEVIFETNCREELSKKECEFIKQFNSLAPNGYNLTSGGEGGYIRSDETRKLLSEANKGKSRSHTPESKAKLSLAKMGCRNPQFGKKQSEETKAKRSASLTGKKRPQWVKDKIRSSHLARNGV